MTTAQERLDSALITWLDLLSGWAASGELSRAATHVLDLDGEKALPQATGRLKSFEAQWEAGVTQNLPEIVILPEEDMNGALGAYAASTNTIYLSEAFLEEATEEAIQNVLTHELGHFLDAQLNEADTPGEEGDEFERSLNGDKHDSNFLLGNERTGILQVNGEPLKAELLISPFNENAISIDIKQIALGLFPGLTYEGFRRAMYTFTQKMMDHY